MPWPAAEPKQTRKRDLATKRIKQDAQETFKKRVDVNCDKLCTNRIDESLNINFRFWFWAVLAGGSAIVRATNCRAGPGMSGCKVIAAK